MASSKSGTVKRAELVLNVHSGGKTWVRRITGISSEAGSKSPFAGEFVEAEAKYMAAADGSLDTTSRLFLLTDGTYQVCRPDVADDDRTKLLDRNVRLWIAVKDGAIRRTDRDTVAAALGVARTGTTATKSGVGMPVASSSAVRL